MSPDLATFCSAMDGEWELVSVVLEGGRETVTYRSLAVPGTTWSHRPLAPNRMPVGTRGRIGFIGRSPKEAF